MPYIITEKTNILIPKKSMTEVIETEKTFIIEEETLDVIMHNCFLNGSSLEGRQHGSAYLLGSSYKPPIILSELDNLIFVPTHSMRNLKCCWINLANILKYYPSSPEKVIIEFKDFQKIELNISYYILDKQILRATRLESTLRGRNLKKQL